MFYNRYGKDNVIEYVNVLKKLTTDEIREFYVRRDLFLTKYPEINDIPIYEYTRLQALQYSLKEAVIEAGLMESKLIGEHLFDWTSSFNKIDTQLAESLVYSKWSNGENFSDRIWKNKDKLYNYLEQELKYGFIRGDNYQKLSKNMREKFVDRSSYEVKRLVRTEGTRLNNEAMMQDILDDENLTEYEYIAVMDSKTSHICKDLDGKIFKIKDREVGVNFPPMHPNCRSTFEPIIPDNYAERR